MYAIRLDSSIPALKVFVFQCGNIYGRWGRAEHIVKCFAYYTEAEQALIEHIAEIKGRIRYTAPECCVYERGIIARLERAEIIMTDDVPEKTEGGVAFIRQA